MIDDATLVYQFASFESRQTLTPRCAGSNGGTNNS